MQAVTKEGDGTAAVVEQTTGGGGEDAVKLPRWIYLSIMAVMVAIATVVISANGNYIIDLVPCWEVVRCPSYCAQFLYGVQCENWIQYNKRYITLTFAIFFIAFNSI